MKYLALLVTLFILCQTKVFSQNVTVTNIVNVTNITNIVNITNVRNESSDSRSSKYIVLPEEEGIVYLEYSSLPPKLIRQLKFEAMLNQRQASMMKRLYP